MHSLHRFAVTQFDRWYAPLIDREIFEQRKAVLLTEKVELEAGLRQTEGQTANPVDRLAKMLELAGTASLLYEMGNLSEKRELLRILSSNRWVDGKNVVVELQEPFRTMAKRGALCDGGPGENRTRASAMRMPRNTTLLQARLVYF